MMKKKLVNVLLSITLISNINIFSNNYTYATEEYKENEEASNLDIEKLDRDSNAEAEKIVAEMNIDEKIGQMLMLDFRQWSGVGDLIEINNEVASVINKYNLGGVILFAQNVKETNQTAKLVHDFQKVITDNNKDTPLLIGIDQEGGIVTRLGSGTNLPGNMAIGATKSDEDAYDAGYVMGRELESLGINVNFAPSVDVNNNPNNPVINLRSISNNPDLVGSIGVSLMKGMQEQGVATSLKHFPGHGDTYIDSHYGLPLVDKSLEELHEIELKPFKIGIDEGADMVMTAHIQFPQVEKDTYISKSTGEEILFPATLSDDIITGILREDLGFEGVVITDAMNMEAISSNFGEVTAVKEAIKADVDILLMPTIIRSLNDTYKLDNIFNGVKEAISSGEISIEEIDDSVTRIVKLKIDRGIMEIDNRTLEEKIAYAEEVVGSDENREIERRISANAITVVKNENNKLPLNPKEGEKILMLAPYDDELPGLEFGLERLIYEEKINKVEFEAISYNNQGYISDYVKNQIDSSNEIIIISEISRAYQMATSSWLTSYIESVINYANSVDKEVIVASIGFPYDVAGRDGAVAKILAYGYKGMDPTEADGGLSPSKAFGPNIPAIIDVVFGAYEAVGTLPVDVPEVILENGEYIYGDNIKYSYGHGITNLTNTGDVVLSAEKLSEDEENKTTNNEDVNNAQTEENLKDDSVDNALDINIGEVITLKADISGINENLQAKNYSLGIEYDNLAFDILEVNSLSEELDVSDFEVIDNILNIKVASEENFITEGNIEVKLKVKEENENTSEEYNRAGLKTISLKNASFIDKENRKFESNISSLELNILEDDKSFLESLPKVFGINILTIGIGIVILFILIFIGSKIIRRK